jgi:hypothetical protein
MCCLEGVNRWFKTSTNMAQQIQNKTRVQLVNYKNYITRFTYVHQKLMISKTRNYMIARYITSSMKAIRK